MIFSTPARRDASSSLRVPSTLTSLSRMGSLMERVTLDCAAMWNTRSGFSRFSTSVREGWLRLMWWKVA